MPPPETCTLTSHSPAIFRLVSGAMASATSRGSGKYCFASLSFTVILPLPAKRRTRAIAVFRRPTASIYFPCGFRRGEHALYAPSEHAPRRVQCRLLLIRLRCSDWGRFYGFFGLQFLGIRLFFFFDENQCLNLRWFKKFRGSILRTASRITIFGFFASRSSSRASFKWPT